MKKNTKQKQKNVFLTTLIRSVIKEPNSELNIHIFNSIYLKYVLYIRLLSNNVSKVTAYPIFAESLYKQQLRSTNMLLPIILEFRIYKHIYKQLVPQPLTRIGMNATIWANVIKEGGS